MHNSHSARSAHVVIVVQNLPVPLDRRVWLEATTLASHGYRVSVIAHAGTGQSHRETVDGIRVLRYPKPPEARTAPGYIVEFAYCWLWTAWRLWQLWREEPFAVIHACNPPETFWLLGRLFRLRGVKFVFDHHDLSPEMFVAKGGRDGSLMHRGLLWLEHMTFRTADAVITTNQSHRDVASERGGVSPARIHVVRSGPDVSRLRILEVDEEIRGGARHLVGYLGEMCRQDGVDHLLHAAAWVLQQNEGKYVRFLLVGGGPELPALKQLAGRLGIGDRVRFMGRVSDDVLNRCLSSVDVCVDPDPKNAWSDRSTMNKIMEYMYFGHPIVAYPLTENRYSAGEALVAARPNDPADLGRQILRVLADPAEAKRRGAAGAVRVRESLMWDHSAPHLLRAYDDLLNPVQPHGTDEDRRAS